MKTAHAILLVEDNPADVKITQRALRKSAVPVDLIVVRDGQEAVEYLLRQGDVRRQSRLAHSGPDIARSQSAAPHRRSGIGTHPRDAGVAHAGRCSYDVAAP